MSTMELRGALSDLLIKNKELDAKAGTKVTAVKHLLATSAITPVEELDVEGVAVLVADLIELKHEKIRNLGAIKKIEKELA